MSGLLTLEQVQDLAIAHAPRGRVAEVPVEQAIGLALAGSVRARRTQPAADLSAMDGYAIAGEGPWRKVGESRAGAPFDGELESGECTRISTGAHLPHGADRVLIQENAVVEGDDVRLAEGEAMPQAGQHVRRKGFDFAEGDEVLTRVGEVIGAGQLALLLAAGIEEVTATLPARVVIIECGDELCERASECGRHQIPATNGAMIAAMLAETGCEIRRPFPVPDDKAELIAAFEAYSDADIMLVSGGASVGDHDHVRDALVEWGAEVRAWKAAIKPGKPIMVANRGDLAVLGLPGNPVSSFVTAFLFALPMVRKSMGFAEVGHPTISAAASDPLPATGSRREFLRGRLHDGRVALAGSQDSSALRSLANANCLIDRPANAPAVAIGETVTIYRLHNGGIAGVSGLPIA